MNKKIRLFRFWTIMAFLMCLSNGRVCAIDLLAPSDGYVSGNNMPTLSWNRVKCNQYEVWIDGVLMESLPSNHTCYTTFPLSFGKHRWQICAVNGTEIEKSAVGSFTIEDKPLTEMPERSQLLRYGWSVVSSWTVGHDGKRLSSANVDVSQWAKTTIPATVLTSLVRNGIYPNPYVGTNNMLIPDLNDDYNKDYDLLKYSHIKGKNPWKAPYWYRTEFACSKQLKGRHIWLNFGELNYQAEIWLNGNRVADTTQVVGMERTFRFDISPYIRRNATNVLAVAIYAPEPSGKPAIEPLTPLGDPGCNMGDGMISHCYTKWDTMGWDWQPAVRDRDMGITEDVYLSASDDVELGNLYVTSDMNLPDTTSADITVSADVKNLSYNNQIFKIRTVISGKGSSFSFDIPCELQPNAMKEIRLDKTVIKKMHLLNPKLWWPFGYGDQNLYSVQMTALQGSKKLSEVVDTFGIRKVETYIGENERVIKINGRRIYPRGGNWVIDMTLNWNASRYEKEILLTRNANLNMLRVWGPTGVAPKALYRAADKYGVMMWQDFLNDYWGTFRNTPGYQPDINIYKEATEDIVRKCRNHPSLVMWCGGNEGVNPHEEMITHDILPIYDGRDSRFYLKSSNGDGLHGGGPYHTLEPKDYFTHTKMMGFSSEIGPSGIPELESVMKFMPRYGRTWLPGKFPLDGVWAYHDANNWPGDDTRKFTAYDTMLRHYYGDVDTTDVQTGFEDYIRKAQSVNYDVYRASIEAINRGLWSHSSGMLLWKSNSSWPSLAWQVYDWYLQAHAGYYGTKKAAEPVHAQWNRDDNSVSVVNVSGRKLNNLSLSIDYYNPVTNWIHSEHESVNADIDQVVKCKLKIETDTVIQFARLSLKNADGMLVSSNTYWLDADNDYRYLKKLNPADVKVNIVKVERHDGKMTVGVDVTNGDRWPAYMFVLRLIGTKSKTELLPSLWDDNYITLLPNEHRVLHVTISDDDLTDIPMLEYHTYNSNNKYINIK